jgi:membrane protease YdiL (CAAX protease family)
MAIRVLFSTVLFSLCHIYEGPWGILNAVLAGIFLSVLFNRYRSIHGIAWAHAAYNMFVYTIGIFNG